ASLVASAGALTNPPPGGRVPSLDRGFWLQEQSPPPPPSSQSPAWPALLPRLWKSWALIRGQVRGGGEGMGRDGPRPAGLGIETVAGVTHRSRILSPSTASFVRARSSGLV